MEIVFILSVQVNSQVNNHVASALVYLKVPIKKDRCINL